MNVFLLHPSTAAGHADKNTWGQHSTVRAASARHSSAGTVITIIAPLNSFPICGAADAAVAIAVAAHQGSVFMSQAPLLVCAGMRFHDLQHLVCIAVVTCHVPRHGLQGWQP
jgi:hypothetical protein